MAASSLRDLFATIALKAGEGLRDLKNFNKGLTSAEGKLGAVETKSEKLGKGLRKLGGAAGKFGKTFAKGVGIASVALVGATVAVNSFVASWAAGADEILKRSQKLGIATAELQKLRFAAELAGANADSVSNSVRDLNKFLLEAARGQAQPFTSALKEIGVELEDLEDKTHIERLALFADGLKGISDEGKKSAIAARLLGRSAGIELAPLLKGGGDAIRAAAKEAEALGGVMSGEALESAAEYNDTWSRVKLVLKGVRNEIAAKVVPTITKFLKRIQKLSLANRDLIANKISEWLDRFIKFLEVAVPAGEKVITMIGNFIDSVGGIDSAIRLAAEAWAVFQLAGLATLGPAGAIAAAIGITLIGIARIDRELKKARKAAIDRNIRLRNPEDPTAGLSVEQLSSDDARALLDATAAATRASRGLRSLQTRSDVLQSQRNRDDAVADTFSGVAGEVLEEATQAQIDAAKKAVTAAEANAERLLARAASERERFDLAQQKRIEAKMDAQTDAERESAAELGRRIDASGDGKVDGKTGGKAKSAGKAKGKPDVKPPTVPEQLAAAFGGRELTGSPLSPKSLGTTINQVDARVIVTVAKVEQTFPLPEGVAPAQVASAARTGMAEVVTDQVEAALVRHRSVFIG
jgi:hypothetical protein